MSDEATMVDEMRRKVISLIFKDSLVRMSFEWFFSAFDKVEQTKMNNYLNLSLLLLFNLHQNSIYRQINRI